MTAKQLRIQKYNREYRKSVTGLVKYIYSHQKRNCSTRGHENPTYNEKELKEWIIAQDNFEAIYNNWVNTDMDKSNTPSVDRLDNSLTYSLDNIQLTTWKENAENAYRDVRENTLNNPTLLNGGHRAIAQVNFDGELVNIFISLAEAARQIGIKHQAISSCCVGTNRVAAGHFWCYAEDVPSFLPTITKEYVEMYKKSAARSRGFKVVIENLDTREIKEYSSIGKVAKLFGVASSTIVRWIEGTASTRRPKPDNIKIKKV